MRNTVIVLICLFLTACAATGPFSAPAAAGGAAVIAVFDQLLAGGVIDPLQHMALTQGIGSIQQSVDAVEKAQAGALTTTEAATAAGGLTATILAAVRAWRGPATKAGKSA